MTQRMFNSMLDGRRRCGHVEQSETRTQFALDEPALMKMQTPRTNPITVLLGLMPTAPPRFASW